MCVCLGLKMSLYWMNLAVGLGSSRQKVIFFMLISACLWSVALTTAVYFGYDFIVDWVQGIQWN